ncbi:MAG: hypothetical protein QM687_14205 [Ferruginibacter sp.]
MANSNPVKTTNNGQYPEFIIAAEHKNKRLFLTTKTTLITDGWKLDLLHAFTLDGKPVDFDPTPDIERKDLGLIKKLDGLKLALASIASRIRDGADGKPSKVKYILKLEAGDELLDEEFEVTTTEKNPVTLFTKITLKVQ